MRDMSLSIDIAATPERVWDVIADLEGWVDTISGITKIERLDGGTGFDSGTRWRETRIMFGREATEEMEITEVDHGRSYAVESDSRGVHYRSTLTLTPLGDATRLTMTFGGKTRGFLANILGATVGRLFEKATRKALQQDLDDISVAAEQRT